MSKYRSYCFTFFEVEGFFDGGVNYDFQYFETVTLHELFLRDNFNYCIFQYEIAPSTGLPHIQGFLNFRNQVSFNSLREYLSPCHLEPTKGSVGRNIHYCSKPVPNCNCSDCDGVSRVDGPYEFGSRPGNLGNLGDWSVLLSHSKTPKKKSKGVFAQIVSMIDEGKTNVEIVRAVPSAFRMLRDMDRYREEITPIRNPDVTPIVCILWGDSGSGKTRYPRDVHGLANVFKGPVPSKKSGVAWFDGYKGESVLLIDDWPLYTHPDLYEVLLDVCDRGSCMLPVKGAHVKLQARYIYITSNENPNLWFGGAGLQSLTRRITGGVCYLQGAYDPNRVYLFTGIGNVPIAP